MDPLLSLLTGEPVDAQSRSEVGALLPPPLPQPRTEKSARRTAPFNTTNFGGRVICGFPAQFGSWENVWLASAARIFSDLIPRKGSALAINATEFIPFLHYHTRGALRVAVANLTAPGTVGKQLSLLVPPVRLSQIFPKETSTNDLVIAGKTSSLPPVRELADLIAPGGSLLVEVVEAVFNDELMRNVYDLGLRFANVNFFVPFGADGRVFLIFRGKRAVEGREEEGEEESEEEGPATPSEDFVKAWTGCVNALEVYCKSLPLKCGLEPASDFLRIWNVLQLPPPAAPALRGAHQEQVIEAPETKRTVAVGYPFEVSVPLWFPQVPYHRRSATQKTVLHWGQRKLFISELQFLLRVTRPDEKNLVVVYAGAASGEHLGALVHLLDLTGRSIRNWVLYDTNRFRFEDHIYGRAYGDYFRVRKEFFEEKTAAELKSQFRNAFGGEKPRFLFISDIRSIGLEKGGREQMSEEAYALKSAAIEKGIAVDMQRQMNWYRDLVGDQPDGAGLFKFRLPYGVGGETEYLNGDLLLPVWGPVSTTECRLLVRGPGKETTRYSNRAHEERMFFFNNVYRTAHHPHLVAGEYDTCYDCRAEIQCLTDLLFQMRLETSEAFRARLKEQKLEQRLGFADRKAVSSLIWDVLEQVNSDLNGTDEFFERPRALEKWVKPFSSVASNAELMRRLPEIVSRLGHRLNREIGSGRSLHSGDPSHADSAARTTCR